MRNIVYKQLRSVANYSQFHKGSQQIHVDRPLRMKDYVMVQPNIIRNPKNIYGWRSPSPYSPRFPGVASCLFQETGRVDPSQGDFSGSMSNTEPVQVSFRWEPSYIAQNECRMRVRNHVADKAIDLGIALAELRKSARTVRTGFGRILRAMDTLGKLKKFDYWILMHGKPHRTDRRLKPVWHREVSATWLEFKYGIMPIVYDVQGALDAITRGSSPLDMRARGRSSPYDTVGSILTMLPRLRNSMTGSVDISFMTKRQVEGVVYFRVRDLDRKPLESIGLSWSAVPNLVWDLTPFSFLIDMVIPISGLLQSWTALGNVDVINYIETEYHTREIQPLAGSREWTDLGANWSSSWNIFPTRTDFLFKRSVYQTVPFPLPFIRNPAKLPNFATVLALATQLRNPGNTLFKR